MDAVAPRTLTFAGSKAHELLRSLKLQNSARSEHMFSQPSGWLGPYVHFDGVWYEAVKTAKLTNFHFNDLRHTCTSYLAQRGNSLLQIAAILGHKTQQVVNRYALTAMRRDL